MNAIPRAFVGWQVLVVDDERDSLEIAARMLKLAGAQVTTSRNGKDALDLLRAAPTRFRFVLSDLSMPDVDGWELLYQFRREPQAADVPVIALTAHAMAGDKERGMAAGFQGYITKPIDPLRFIQQLVDILSSVPAYAALLKPE